MKRAGTISAAILLANLTLATLMYQTIGWHFIRGYNEVGNFLVVTCAIAQAGLNLLAAAPIAFVRRWRRTRGGQITLLSLFLSGAVVVLSLLFSPLIGSVAKRNLWIETPLVEAARYGDAELVITLVKKGADPNAKQPVLGTTPLHYMAGRGELEAVEALLKNGADANAKAATSMETPLHWAVRYRANLMTINSLVNHGADPALKDWHGETPVEYTATIPHPLCSDMLNAMGRSAVPEPLEVLVPQRPPVAEDAQRF